MLSYIFENGKRRRNEIKKLCENEFELKIIRENEHCTFLTSSMLTILIKTDFTHIVLKSENVDIKNIENYF